MGMLIMEIAKGYDKKRGKRNREYLLHKSEISLIQNWSNMHKAKQPLLVRI